MTQQPDTTAGQLPTTRRRQTKRGHISPALWSVMHRRFVSGELNDLYQVSMELGISAKNVRARAAREGWTKDRQEHAERVIAHTKVSGLLMIEPANNAELQSAMSKIAQSVLAMAPELLDSAKTLTRSIDQLSARLPSSGDADPKRGSTVPDRLTAAVSARDATIDMLCRLAGLPEPGRMSAKPSTSTAPMQSHDPASFQPVGLADEGGGGGS